MLKYPLRPFLLFFPLCPRGRYPSAECIDRGIEGPASGRRGGPLHKVNLSPALDPQSSGGRGRAPPLLLFGRKPWKLFSLSCSVVGCCPFSCGEGLFRGPQIGLFSERIFSKEVPSFLSSSPFCWELPSCLLRGKRTPFPEAEVSVPLTTGP
jgi:hypothetical protein